MNRGEKEMNDSTSSHHLLLKIPLGPEFLEVVSDRKGTDARERRVGSERSLVTSRSCRCWSASSE